MAEVIEAVGQYASLTIEAEGSYVPTIAGNGSYVPTPLVAEGSDTPTIQADGSSWSEEE